jgi:hypothetical protein
LDANFFLTIAEIAVALAGFGSIAALIGRRASVDSAAVDAQRLRAMLEDSLATMFLAVLPIALARFAIPDGVVWGICGVLFILVVPYLWWSQVRRVRSLPTYQPGIAFQTAGRVNRLATVGLLAAGLSGVIALVPAYGLALVLELALAAAMFLRVASSLIASHEPAV